MYNTLKFLPKASIGLMISAVFSMTAFAADAPLTGRAKEVAERFAAADKNKDGKLTLEEAKEGMPRIALAFDKIDTENRGYLTLEQIQIVVADAP